MEAAGESPKGPAWLWGRMDLPLQCCMMDPQGLAVAAPQSD